MLKCPVFHGKIGFVIVKSNPGAGGCSCQHNTGHKLRCHSRPKYFQIISKVVHANSSLNENRMWIRNSISIWFNQFQPGVLYIILKNTASLSSHRKGKYPEFPTKFNCHMLRARNEGLLHPYNQRNLNTFQILKFHQYELSLQFI